MSIEQEADDFAAEESANDVVEVAEDVQEATPADAQSAEPPAVVDPDVLPAGPVVRAAHLLWL